MAPDKGAAEPAEACAFLVDITFLVRFIWVALLRVNSALAALAEEVVVVVVAVVSLTLSRIVPGVRCSVCGGGCRLAKWDSLTLGDKGVKGAAAGAFGTVVVAVMEELLLRPILRDFLSLFGSPSSLSLQA